MNYANGNQEPIYYSQQIYKVTNSVDNHVYIGISRNMIISEVRLKHIDMTTHDWDRCAISELIKTYGVDKFNFEFIESFYDTLQEHREIEFEYQMRFSTLNHPSQIPRLTLLRIQRELRLADPVWQQQQKDKKAAYRK